MFELIAVRVYLSAFVAHFRDDERGEMPIEGTILATMVVILAVTVLFLGILKLARLFAGS